MYAFILSVLWALIVAILWINKTNDKTIIKAHVINANIYSVSFFSVLAVELFLSLLPFVYPRFQITRSPRLQLLLFFSLFLFLLVHEITTAIDRTLCGLVIDIVWWIRASFYRCSTRLIQRCNVRVKCCELIFQWRFLQFDKNNTLND